jgi:hypothetical protein
MAAAEAAAPLVLYTFDEGGGNIVRDVSGRGTPLDLTIANPKAVTWEAGSLRINAGTLIASSSSATKVTNALKTSNAVTVEAWVKSAAVAQGGPARILTVSKDAYLRNLTLGQEQARYDVRLRTTKTDTNGRPAVSTADGTLNTSLAHVVYTRNASGVVEVYLNGVRQLQTTIAGDFSNWDGAYRLALGNELDGKRPWLGTLHQVAIYDRAFTSTDVSSAFTAASSGTVHAGNEVTTDSGTGSVIDTTPVAKDDTASTSGALVTIDVLANDSGLMDAPVRVSLIAKPASGTASVQSDNKVVYTPASGFSGTDSFTYAVTDADGDVATATVSIQVVCTACVSSDRSLTLSWDASAGEVLGYYVYYGSTASTVGTFASKVQSEMATYLSATDLNLKTGDPVCFRVKAYNTSGESAFSAASCTNL